MPTTDFSPLSEHTYYIKFLTAHGELMTNRPSGRALPWSAKPKGLTYHQLFNEIDNLTRNAIGNLKDKFTGFTATTGKWKRIKPTFIGLSLVDM